MSNSTSIKQPVSAKILHLLFWTIVTLIFIYDRRYLIQKFQLPEHFIACVTIRMGLLISLVYLHLNVLVPRFFKKRSYVKYTALLLLSLGIYVSLQNLYDIYLYGYVIGDVRSRSFFGAFSYNFLTTLWYLALTAGLKFGLDKYFEKSKADESNLPPNPPMSDPQEKSILLKTGTKQIMTDLDTVTHVKGLKDYSIIYTTAEQIIVKGSLKNAEILLGDKKLVRVHKSYLVALDRIKTIQNNQIILENHAIPIGRSYKKELFQLLVPS